LSFQNEEKEEGHRTMTKPILFSLEHCPKCDQTKQLLTNRDDVDIITFPHDLATWTPQHLELALGHDVFEDLKITAPILWKDGKKTVGYLRIKKWLLETANQS
jgi:hypothetical protein